MPKSIKHIRIIESSNKSEMEEELNGLIQSGWELHGVLSVSPRSSQNVRSNTQTIYRNTYTQAVVKSE